MKDKSLRVVLVIMILSYSSLPHADAEFNEASSADYLCIEPNTEEYQKAKSAFLIYDQEAFTNKSAFAALESMQKYINDREPEAALIYWPNAQNLIQGHLLFVSAKNAINNENLSDTEKEQIVDRFCRFWENARITE